MFRTSFVCTGNRCRSATAAAALSELGAGLLAVDSCGLLQLDGARPPRETVVAARELGIDLSSHRSAWFGDCNLGASDLVLGFERQHVASAVVEGGASAERAFTLLEFIRLAERVEPPEMDDLEERARCVVRAAHNARKQQSAFVAGEEIADPIGAPLEVHRKTAREIEALCEGLVVALFGRQAQLPSIQ